MSFLRLDALKSNVLELERTILDKSVRKNVAIFVGGVTTSYVVYKTVRFYLKKRKYRHIPGPPTNGLFGYFTGNINEIREEIDKGKVLPDLLIKWHDTYGDVFKFQMYDKIMVVTSDKDTIKEALIVKNFPKQENIDERVGFPLGQRFMGIGLLTELDYEKWKHRRAIFNPGFHRHVLVTFVGHFNQIVNTLSDKFRTVADGNTVVNIFDEVNRATLDAIALIAFGMNTESITIKDSLLNMYLSRVLGMITDTFFDPFLKYRPSRFKDVQEFGKMTRYLREVGRNRILERLNAMKNNEHMPDDILTSILRNYKEDSMDIEAMTDDFITFFVAGQETTANTLAFVFQELARHPEIVAKAREEIDRVLGERTEITYQDVNDLKYCSAIFKEALRLYPPAANLLRSVPEKMSIKGYEIPKGAFLWISTYMNGRCEKYFNNALEFKPDRFFKTPDSTDSKFENYVYLPFSLGPRNCIGQNFAQLEGVIVIAKLLQKFDFKLDPKQSFAIVQKLTLRPKDGTRCFLTLRN